MKRIPGFFAFAATLSAAVGALAAEIDGIAAKVDSAVILKSDVYSELRRMGEGRDRFVQVRNDMIDRRLIVKAAGEAKMTIPEWVIENRIREIIQKSFDGDRNRLMEVLAQEKISYAEWRNRLKDDMVVSAMRWQTVDKNVVVSPQQLREEFSKHPERYVESNKVTVSVILLKPENASKRDEVAKALREMPFAEVARKYSADAHAAEGGVWKDVNPDEVFRPEVSREIADMPKGTFSHWIDLDGWSFLLRKDSQRDAHARSFVEAYDDVEANVREELAARRYEEWLARLRRSAYIKVCD